MNEEKIYDLAVIGGGAAGQMALLRGVLNHLKTVAFWGDAHTSKRSRATWVSVVDNIPGFFDKKRPITATSREVIKFIKSHEDLSSFMTHLKEAALSIEKNDGIFSITSKSGKIQTKYVVLCTGTMDIQPHIQGSIEPILPFANREDVLYCIRCDGHRCVGHQTAVIGHTESAAWIAIMLKERYDLPKIYILNHGQPFESSEEVKKILQKYKIEIIPGEIEKVLGDPRKELEGFLVQGKEIRVAKAFVALGSIVYNELAKGLGAKINERDHLLTNEKGETSVEGLFAAGDMVQGKKKQVYTAWDGAVDAVDAIDTRVRVEKRRRIN